VSHFVHLLLKPTIAIIRETFDTISLFRRNIYFERNNVLFKPVMEEEVNKVVNSSKIGKTLKSNGGFHLKFSLHART
jgi:hypothetical protein